MERGVGGWRTARNRGQRLLPNCGNRSLMYHPVPSCCLCFGALKLVLDFCSTCPQAAFISTSMQSMTSLNPQVEQALVRCRCESSSHPKLVCSDQVGSLLSATRRRICYLSPFFESLEIHYFPRKSAMCLLGTGFKGYLLVNMRRSQAPKFP